MPAAPHETLKLKTTRSDDKRPNGEKGLQHSGLMKPAIGVLNAGQERVMISIAHIVLLGMTVAAGVAAYDLPVRKLEAAVAKHQDRLIAFDSPADLTTGSLTNRERRGKADRLDFGMGTRTARTEAAASCRPDGEAVALVASQGANGSRVSQGPCNGRPSL